MQLSTYDYVIMYTDSVRVLDLYLDEDKAVQAFNSMNSLNVLNGRISLYKRKLDVTYEDITGAIRKNKLGRMG